MTVYQVPLGSTFTGTTVCTVWHKTKLMTHYNNESSMWCVTRMWCTVLTVNSSCTLWQIHLLGKKNKVLHRRNVKLLYPSIRCVCPFLPFNPTIQAKGQTQKQSLSLILAWLLWPQILWYLSTSSFSLIKMDTDSRIRISGAVTYFLTHHSVFSQLWEQKKKARSKVTVHSFFSIDGWCNWISCSMQFFRTSWMETWDIVYVFNIAIQKTGAAQWGSG